MFAAKITIHFLYCLLLLLHKRNVLKFIAGFALLMLSLAPSFAQKKEQGPQKKKGSFYFYWGYNRSFFSNTNLHFTGPNYDFTVYNVKGSDKPTSFGTVYFNPSSFTIPQYNYRVGFFLTDRVAVSLGMDHMKYVMTGGQNATISGVVSSEASEKYAGSYLNKPIKVEDDLLTFEHTDGFNFASIELEYLQPVVSFWNKRFTLYWNAGVGGVWVITKTNVKVFEDGLDNNFHMSGYALALKTGPRLEYRNRIFLAGEVKGGYASLPSVLIKNDAPEVGDHNISFGEYYVVLGVNFRLKSPW